MLIWNGQLSSDSTINEVCRACQKK